MERIVVAHMAVLVVELWETRSCFRPPSRDDLIASLRVNFPALRSVFEPPAFFPALVVVGGTLDFPLAIALAGFS